jgi:hypothetical protein
MCGVNETRYCSKKEVWTMERLKQSLVPVIISVFCFGGYVFSDEPATEAKMELRQVALFKNGLGFFVSEVTIPEKVKSFYVVTPAAATHGTFWVSYPEKVKLKALTAKEVEVEELKEAMTTGELLRGNVGRKVRLLVSTGCEGTGTVEGTIAYCAVPEIAEKPNPYAPGSVVNDERSSYYRSPDIVIIKTEAGEMVIGAGRIQRVEFAGEQAVRTFSKKGKSVRLDVDLGTAAGGAKMTVSYLAKGVTWAPSYMVDITEPDKARLAAKAEVMDEVCDLNGVDVKLVTGFPNLKFADVASPITMKENLAQFLQSLMRGQGEQGQARGVLSNVMVQTMAYDEATRAGELSLMPGYGAAAMGKSAEDLFLYPVEKVRLAKGAVGYFPLFTASVPYTHIYRWEIPDYVKPEGDYYDQGRQQQKPEQQEVWHCIRLENVMKMPWTTAPSEIIKDGVILGQDTLDYTPVKGKGTVKITRAMNVKAEQIELEKDRKRDAAQWYNYHYDLVTVEGKLSATNLQDKPITLEITKVLSGEVKAMQPEAKLEKMAKALRAVNANVKLTWTMELGAGEKKDISYTYEVYVRR